VLTRAGNTC